MTRREGFSYGFFRWAFIGSIPLALLGGFEAWKTHREWAQIAVPLIVLPSITGLNLLFVRYIRRRAHRSPANQLQVRPSPTPETSTLRVKLFVFLLIPDAVAAGWLMFLACRVLGRPLLVQPQGMAFILFMGGICGLLFATIAAVTFRWLGLMLVRQNRQFVLIDTRSTELARRQ